MKATIAIVILSSLLAGCAAKIWNHPTATEGQFRQESSLCERTALVSNPGTPYVHNPYLDPFQRANAGISQGTADLGRAFAIKNAFENCMAIKGYTSQ